MRLTQFIPACRIVVILILFNIAITLLNGLICQNDNVKVILIISSSLGKRSVGMSSLFLYLTELSLISPFRRERLIFNDYTAFSNSVFIKFSPHSDYFLQLFLKQNFSFTLS